MRFKTAMFLISAMATFVAGHVPAAEVGFVLEGKTYRATLVDNDATKFLMKRAPMYLCFETLGTGQRISYLKGTLPIGKAPKKFNGAKKGDLAYFLYRKNITLFLEDPENTEGYVPLGRVASETFDMIRHSESKVMEFVKLQ